VLIQRLLVPFLLFNVVRNLFESCFGSGALVAAEFGLIPASFVDDGLSGDYSVVAWLPEFLPFFFLYVL